MKIRLFDFQDDTLYKLRTKLSDARQHASISNPQAISYSAPTGSGKTIVMTALFEDIFFGEPGFEPQSDAVILWISDIPELNQQTRLKIESKSDRIRIRQLVNIDASIDVKQLEGGYIYFINTQKLGTDKLLNRQGDGRNYTIWETFTNTAKAIPNKFYVVIDEAHRGMRTDTDITDPKTIMQRFLLGFTDDGLSPMPMVIGVSATPKRFEELLSGTTHTVHKVYINAEDVRESGLLKDRILINYPENATQVEMTMLAEAAKRWQDIEQRWSDFCKKEGENKVNPLLVIQVEDGNEDILTNTNLSTCLSTLEYVLGRNFYEGEVAHTFHKVGKLKIDGYCIRHVEASRIQEETNIRVVFFKLSLSTGWDCPRAEVMMSFRRAENHTYIAQLLGRMVRTPLARRVEVDTALNDVYLFLPYFNQETVETVIKDFNNSEDVPPVETVTTREQVILHRVSGLDDVFEAMNKLVTYRVNKTRKQSSLRRLLGLSRGLTHDKIDDSLLERVKIQIVNKMATEIQRLKDFDLYKEMVRQILSVDIKTISLERGTGTYKKDGEYVIATVSADLEEYFQQSGRFLSNGLHMEYWHAKEDKETDEIKADVVVLTKDHEGMRNLENFAENLFDNLYTKYKRDIVKLKEQRRKHYERLRLSFSDPKDIPWVLPEIIDFQRSVKAQIYEKHLYLEEDGSFRADIGPWEKDVLEIELKDKTVVGWLRNLDRKKWSMEIPYREAGLIKPMYPDLIVVRQDTKGIQFDILEPHNPSLRDNASKAVGLAEFSEKHWGLFGRIQLIRKKRGEEGVDRYYRLDMGNDAVRRKVLSVTSNDQLDQIFEADAIL